MSDDLRFMLFTLSGLVVLFCMVTALKLHLARRGDPAVPCVLAVPAVLVALVSLALTPPPPRYSAEERARIDSIRIAITPALERYRQVHGEDPVTLSNAGLQTPQTRYGPLHYYGSRGETPPWYLISFGDPGSNGFSADWDSRLGKWSLY